jgi:hypothetical protein
MTASAGRGRLAAANQTADPALHNDHSGASLMTIANDQTAAQSGG